MLCPLLKRDNLERIKKLYSVEFADFDVNHSFYHLVFNWFYNVPRMVTSTHKRILLFLLVRVMTTTYAFGI